MDWPDPNHGVRSSSVSRTRPLSPTARLWRPAVLLAAGLLAGAGSPARHIVAAPAPEEFVYQGQTFLMDEFSVLFDSSALGRERLRLFTDYLKSQPEGQARAKKAGSTDPAIVWRTMSHDERATFLAVTKSLEVVQPQSGRITWIDRIDEIHGDRSFSTGSQYR